ncbi:hypothetical protein KCU81_g7237, partial [Aureobasidium melanogenum]|uniref:DUF7918 domain-containing protein n=1 Tax=Aureobasidium melanogenum (strain CBS 110374) TaxID=1043003 RepID=A0A074VU15_AURM1
MAVLDGLPGVEIAVVVDTKDLPEYQDSDTANKEDTVTKYIEAVDGANFAAKIKLTKDFVFKGDLICVQVRIDGTRVCGLCLVPADVQAGSYNYNVDNIRVNNESARRLKFKVLETVSEEDAGVSDNRERVQNMGKIEIRVDHENKTGVGTSTNDYQSPVIDESVISEKDVKGKAITHTYGLGEEIEVKSGNVVWYTAPVLGVKSPAATFVFHYRSKAALKDLLIIPRTPAPTPLEERPIEKLSHEETRELLRRYQAERTNTATVKKEPKREREDNSSRNCRRSKRARPTPGSVYLELNDDDTFTQIAVPEKEQEQDVSPLD